MLRASWITAKVRPRAGRATQGRRAEPEAQATIAPPEETLRERAEAALVLADDAVMSSAEELEVVRADGGDDVDRFAAAVAASRQEVDEGYLLYERAVADPPDPDEEELLERVRDLCGTAEHRLDATATSFDSWRDLEGTVDTALRRVGLDLTVLRERVPQSVRTAEELLTRYPQVALATALANLDLARSRLRFLDDSVRVAGELLTSGDRRAAAARLRAAESADEQARRLLDCLDRVPGEFERYVAAVDTLVAQTRKDLADADQPSLSDAAVTARRFASATLEWVGSAVRAGPVDPQATRRALWESDSALVRALSGGAASDTERAQALVPGCRDAANAAVLAATDVITTRRAVVGIEARTRLARAKRELRAADETDDVLARLGHLQRADGLADQALALAQQDEARAANTASVAGTDVRGLGSVIAGGILVRLGVRRPARIEPDPSAGIGGGLLPVNASIGAVGAVSFGGTATRTRRGSLGGFPTA